LAGGVTVQALPKGDHVNRRFFEWIWHIRGSLALAPGQSGDDALDKLAPLFRQTGTSHERTDDTLTFRKKDQAAQDKMSVFDGGILQVQKDEAGSVLRYNLTSRALLLCFLAPLLFLGIAQFTIVVAKLHKPSTEAIEAAKKHAKKIAAVPMNPIDKALGAPPPEKPKEESKGKGKDKKDDEGKPTPTAAYVFAAIFATLYVVGRILEASLIKRLFRRSLLAS
jgi:hypothetical protein